MNETIQFDGAVFITFVSCLIVGLSAAPTIARKGYEELAHRRKTQRPYFRWPC